MSAKRLNDLEMLIKEIMQREAEGVLKRPSPTLQKNISANINQRLKKWGQILLNKQIKGFLVPFRKHFYASKREIKEALGVRGYRLQELGGEFERLYKSMAEASISLIKAQNKSDIEKLRNRFIGWVNMQSIKGGDKPTLKQYISLPNTKKTRLLLRDQNNKMSANMDLIASAHFNAIAFQWKTRNDNRVVGKPSGLYPKGTPAHNDHWARKDKWFYYERAKNDIIRAGIDLSEFENSAEWLNEHADGMPAMAINCRCYAKNVYRIQDLPFFKG